LLTAARATLEKATARKDVLVTLGMSQKVLEDLARRWASSSGRWRRRGRAGASMQVRAQPRSHRAAIGEQVKLLDGVVQYQFGDDAELMGAWASARNVLGPFKPKEQPQLGEGGSQTPKAA